MATPEPTEEPAPDPQEYVVESGDTWYGISDAFGVDVNALAAENDRTLDDVLRVGETIIIPQ